MDRPTGHRKSMLPTFGPARRCASGGKGIGSNKRRESLDGGSLTSSSSLGGGRRPLQARQNRSSIPPPSVIKVVESSVTYMKSSQSAPLPPLPTLRETVARIEIESKRLAVIAYTRPKGMRPSEEVMDLCQRLLGASHSALESLQTLFPPELFPDLHLEANIAAAAALGRITVPPAPILSVPPPVSTMQVPMSSSTSATMMNAQPSPVEEEEEEVAVEGKDDATLALEEAKAMSAKDQVLADAVQLIESILDEREHDEDEDEEKEDDDERDAIEEGEEEVVVIGRIESESGGERQAAAGAVGLCSSFTPEEKEVGETTASSASHRQVAPSHRPHHEPDSPPTMSDLGLSNATRRFISTAVQEGEKPSPESPKLPKSRQKDAAIIIDTPPMASTPEGGQDGHYPSPVFRTGIKLKHPPSERRHQASEDNDPGSSCNIGRETNQSITSSSSSYSSCRSPILFEPRSVDRRGARRSLYPPLPSAFTGRKDREATTAVATQGPSLFSSRRASLGTQGKALSTSFASSSAATPSLNSPSLLRRHQNISMMRSRTDGNLAEGGRGHTDASKESDDPTPELTSPAKTPFRPLPAELMSGSTMSDDRQAAGATASTPTTARVTRLLAFPGSDLGSSKAPRTRTSLLDVHHANERGADLNESMTYNYPDLTIHETSFRFSPKALGLLDRELPPASTVPATTLPTTRPIMEPSSPSTPPPPPTPSHLYFLRSAEKARASLAEEKEGAAAASTSKSSTRTKSPRSALRSRSTAATSSKSPRLSTTSATKSPRRRTPKSPREGIRKSPRLSRMSFQRKQDDLDQEEEDERRASSALAAEPFQQQEKIVYVPLSEVGQEEYEKTPTFIRIQVTREMLNNAINCLNAFTERANILEPLALDKVTYVIGQGDTSKTVLLSLIHLKRIEIVMNAEGLKAYKIWK